MIPSIELTSTLDGEACFSAYANASGPSLVALVRSWEVLLLNWYPGDGSSGSISHFRDLLSYYCFSFLTFTTHEQRYTTE